MCYLWSLKIYSLNLLNRVNRIDRGHVKLM
jgi:hypothetical protein